MYLTILHIRLLYILMDIANENKITNDKYVEYNTKNKNALLIITI